MRFSDNLLAKINRDRLLRLMNLEQFAQRQAGKLSGGMKQN
ncbi:MAG: hypothetical protein V7K25_04885 [Nostoc sp.]